MHWLVNGKTFVLIQFSATRAFIGAASYILSSVDLGKVFKQLHEKLSPSNPRPINLFINYEFFLLAHFLAMNSNSSIFVCFSSSKGKCFLVSRLVKSFSSLSWRSFVYLNCNRGVHSNASSCKHESHPHSEHKNMTNKHHLREFQVAFYVFMVRLFILLLAFYIWVLISGQQERKQNEHKRRPDPTALPAENWIIKKSVQLIWELLIK